MSAARAEWTVDMLDALPDDGQRYELVDGIVHVTPAPGLNHQLIVGHLHHLLKLYLSGSTVGRPLMSPSDVHRGDRTRNRVQPDVFVVRLVRTDRVVTRPLAIAETFAELECTFVKSSSDWHVCSALTTGFVRASDYKYANESSASCM